MYRPSSGTTASSYRFIFRDVTPSGGHTASNKGRTVHHTYPNDVHLNQICCCPSGCGAALWAEHVVTALAVGALSRRGIDFPASSAQKILQVKGLNSPCHELFSRKNPPEKIRKSQMISKPWPLLLPPPGPPIYRFLVVVYRNHKALTSVDPSSGPG